VWGLFWIDSHQANVCDGAELLDIILMKVKLACLFCVEFRMTWKEFSKLVLSFSGHYSVKIHKCKPLIHGCFPISCFFCLKIHKQLDLFSQFAILSQVYIKHWQFVLSDFIVSCWTYQIQPNCMWLAEFKYNLHGLVIFFPCLNGLYSLFCILMHCLYGSGYYVWSLMFLHVCFDRPSFSVN